MRGMSPHANEANIFDYVGGPDIGDQATRGGTSVADRNELHLLPRYERIRPERAKLITRLCKVITSSIYDLLTFASTAMCSG
jgi:hypothetical protein